MIGQQYAPQARSDATAVQVPGIRGKFGRGPAAAGYRRLLVLLGESILVQLMLAMALVAFAAMIYLAQASQASVIEVNISSLQYQRGQLALQNAQLQASATTLQSLNRVSRIATSQLKMTPSTPQGMIWVNAEMPRLTPVRTQYADDNAAIRRSQPLSWMKNIVHAVLASL